MLNRGFWYTDYNFFFYIINKDRLLKSIDLVQGTHFTRSARENGQQRVAMWG